MHHCIANKVVRIKLSKSWEMLATNLHDCLLAHTPDLWNMQAGKHRPLINYCVQSKHARCKAHGQTAIKRPSTVAQSSLK